MQKKLLAMAVAGALLAPLAAQAQSSNVQIYGRIQPSVDRVDNGDTTGTSVASNSSRIGFRGSEDLGNGLKAIFQLESSVNPDELGGTWTGRDSWVGLASSSFGTVRIGSMFTAYKSSTDYADPFVDTIGDYNNVLGSLSAGNRPFDARSRNAIAYTSPNFGGVTITATYGMNSAGTGNTFESQGNNTDRSIAATYKAGALTLTAAYEDKQQNFRGATDNVKAYKLSGGYKFGNTAVALVYAKEDYGDDSNPQIGSIVVGGNTVPVLAYDGAAIRGSDRDRSVISASLKHSMGNIDLLAAYTWADDLGDVRKSGADQFSLGAVYNFSKRTSLGAYYVQLDNDANAFQGLASGGYNPADNGEKVKAFSVRLRHDF